MRSTTPRAVRAEESSGHNNDGKSGRLLLRQSLRQRVVLVALFVPHSSQPKSPPYPGTLISPRFPKGNKPLGKSAYSRFPSAKKRAESRKSISCAAILCVILLKDRDVRPAVSMYQDSVLASPSRTPYTGEKPSSCEILCTRPSFR